MNPTRAANAAPVRPLRILYHHRTQAEDAQGVHIRAMVEAFRRQGHEVEVASLVRTTGGPAPTSASGLRRPLDWLVNRSPAWAYELLTLAYNGYGYLQLLGRARRFRPDVIYERYALNTLCGIWVSRTMRIPLLLEINSPLALEQAQLGRLSLVGLARKTERWICSRSTRTIAVSEVLRQHLIAEGVKADHIAVIPNGIDPERFTAGARGDAIRSRHSIAQGTVVGFVGWMRPWHGIDVLLEALAGSGAAGPAPHLLLVGDGPALPDLRARAGELGVASRVTFAGSVPHDEIPQYIAAMDIAVQPSAPEYACPMKLFEYMAMGKCIIAPDQPNIREILEDGATGLLVRPRDSGALKEAIHRAVSDPALRARVGGGARAALYRRGFLWEENARRALSLL